LPTAAPPPDHPISDRENTPRAYFGGNDGIAIDQRVLQCQKEDVRHLALNLQA